MNRQIIHFLAGLLTTCLLSPGASAVTGTSGLTSPVTTDNFLLRNTADLVSLCNAQPSDPNRIAAIHFCQGFILGIRHYDDTSQNALKDNFYCQDQRVTRDQGMAMYVKWHLDHPQYQSEAPLDGVVRWAMATWPCPQEPIQSKPSAPPRRK